MYQQGHSAADACQSLHCSNDNDREGILESDLPLPFTLDIDGWAEQPHYFDYLLWQLQWTSKFQIIICTCTGADHKLTFWGKIWHTLCRFNCIVPEISSIQVHALVFNPSFQHVFHLNWLQKENDITNNTEATEEGAIPQTPCQSGLFKGLAKRIFTESCLKNMQPTILLGAQAVSVKPPPASAPRKCLQLGAQYDASRPDWSTSKREHPDERIYREVVLLWDLAYCTDFSLKQPLEEKKKEKKGQTPGRNISLKSVAGTAILSHTVTGFFLTSKHCDLFQDDGVRVRTKHKSHIKVSAQGLQVSLWALPLWWPFLIFPQQLALDCFYLTMSFWKLLLQQDKVQMITWMVKQMYELYKVRRLN